MRREGCDESQLDLSDFLCDFCHQAWADDRAMVEGHRGSCVCSQCLTVAYTEVVLLEQSPAPAAYTCRLCLETRDEPGWASPIDQEACICQRCIKQSAGVLSKDKEISWSRPMR